MYDFEYNGLLRIASGPSRYSEQYSREEIEEISATLKAIEQLNERIKSLDKKKRVKMLLHGGEALVWLVESADLRGMPVYVDRKTVYIQMRCGALQPVKPRALGGISNMDGITAEELSFTARFI